MTERRSTIVQADFLVDLAVVLTRKMEERGMTVPPVASVEDLGHHFLNRLRREILPRKRRCLTSTQLTIKIPSLSTEDQRGLERIREASERGEDLWPHLSHLVTKNAADGMLAVFGAHHLHLRDVPPPPTKHWLVNDGFNDRSKNILIAVVRRDEMLWVDVLPHGAADAPWSKAHLIEIVRDEWPRVLGPSLGVSRAPPMPERDHDLARRSGVTPITVLSDGQMYIGPGGGVTTGRMGPDKTDPDAPVVSSLVRDAFDDLVEDVLALQEHLVDAADNLRESARRFGKRGRVLRLKLVDIEPFVVRERGGAQWTFPPRREMRIYHPHG